MVPAEIAERLWKAQFPGGAHCEERIETHRSWVFLTQAQAYKLRKVVADGPLSSQDVEGRRRASEQELVLNRRLAPNVYLRLVPVVDDPPALRVDGPGPIIDWLIEMRRLPRDRMLDACIARRSVPLAEIDAVTATLVAFYRRTERVPLQGPEYLARLEADIEAKRAVLEKPKYGLDLGLVEAAAVRQRGRLRANASLLEQRGRAVMDAHGDLRPEHICLEPQPVVIDCLDFDRELRLLDPLSELSFLALECERLGAACIGQRVLSRYTALTDDHAPLPLIDFYRGLHALVRAAVAVWHLDDLPDSATRWRARAHQYLSMADRGLSNAALWSPSDVGALG